MNNIGASSRSPSPITTVPSIGKRVKGMAHRFNRGLVGGVLVAAADLQTRRQWRRLR